MKKKHWKVSVFDKTSEIVRNDTFYVTDTEGYLVFELIDKDFTPDSASITVYNTYGKVTIHVTMLEVVDGIVHYEMPVEGIRHSGDWRTQVVFTKDNEDYTTEVIEFDVGGHLLGNKKTPMVVIDNWNSFIKYARDLIVDWKQLEKIRQVNETQRELAESVRQNEFETNETERQNEFETNEDERESAFEERYGQLEEEYAPKLTEVTAQLTQNTTLFNEAIANVTVDSEVITARNSGVKGKSFTVLDERFEENELDLVNHKLDYVEYIESELGEEHIIRSLPNGTKDEVSVSEGKKYQRTNEKILEEIDVTTMLTTYSNVDIAYVRVPSDSVIPSNGVVNWYSLEGYPSIDKRSSASDYLSSDINHSTWTFVPNSLGVLLPKGTTLQQAKDLLTGKSLTYQLATPILIPLPEQMTPNTIEIARLSELTNKLTNAIISLGGTIV